jgi:TPR repeat protein
MDETEFAISPPREWDEGTSEQFYLQSKETGELTLVADNSILRGERPLTIKEARQIIESDGALGLMTDEGRKNLIKSLVDQSDHPVAQYLLGVCYYYGRCIDRSTDEATKWWLKAAEQGHFKAQSNIGVLFLERKGDKESEEAAVKWFRLAAKQGDALAQCNLAFCYREGIGVEKSKEIAIRWLKIAAEQGDEFAKEELKKLKE